MLAVISIRWLFDEHSRSADYQAVSLSLRDFLNPRTSFDFDYSSGDLLADWRSAVQKINEHKPVLMFSSSVHDFLIFSKENYVLDETTLELVKKI